MAISDWIQKTLEPLVKVAVDEAVADLHADVMAGMQQLETNLLAQFNQLPGLVASQVENVALDAEQVAEKVAQQFSNFINTGDIAQSVVKGVIGALPHLPGFGETEQTGRSKTVRANRQGMESKEYRAPQRGEDVLEPTPESVAKLRAEAKAEDKPDAS